MKKTLVSVILVNYNNDKYLEECIESILSQTYHNIELIIVDDGSTDSSRDIINIYSEKKNIKIINKSNGGVSSARNAGLNIIQGKYLIFADSDDIFNPRWIECLVNALQVEDVQLSICDYTRFDTKGKILNKSFDVRPSSGIYSSIDVEYLMFTSLSGTCWNKLYVADVIRSNDITFEETSRNYQDMEFNVKYLSYISQVNIINDSLIMYRVLPTSASRNVSMNILNMKKIYNNILSLARNPKTKSYIIAQKALFPITGAGKAKLKKDIALYHGFVKWWEDDKRISFLNFKILNNRKKVIYIFARMNFSITTTILTKLYR
jgi:glycosyltransferase involved in cell wall biosynthesis